MVTHLLYKAGCRASVTNVCLLLMLAVRMLSYERNESKRIGMDQNTETEKKKTAQSTEVTVYELSEMTSSDYVDDCKDSFCCTK